MGSFSILLLIVFITQAYTFDDKEEVISQLISRIDDLLAKNDELTQNLDDSKPPIGSIIPWLCPDWAKLPPGWQRCDGSEVLSGELIGSLTPNLNNAGLFLRGGPDSAIGNLQEASLEDHTHMDNGHSHKDRGHTHAEGGHYHYHDGEAPADGHHSMFIHRNPDTRSCSSETTLIEDSNNWLLRYCVDQIYTTETTYIKIESANADIEPSYSGIQGATGARVSEET